jgi:hypothetical protein
VRSVGSAASGDIGVVTDLVNASMPSMTASKRIEERRSNECWAPGSST